MVRTVFARFTIGAVAALVTLAANNQADAFGHHHRWHGGSGGGWGSSGGGWGGSSGGWGSSGGGWGSSGGGWGSSGGGWGGHHRHGHWKWGGGSWGGSSGGGYWGGSSGGWGSSGGGSSGGWGSSGGSSGGGGGYYYSPGVEMTPVDPSVAPPVVAPPAGTPPPAPAPGTSTSNTQADGLLAVRVPDEARIYVNGQQTTSKGALRQYVSRDLMPGFNYTYEVRAELVRDGRTIEQVKKIDLRAGQTANLAFDFAAGDNVETSLTVHVPSDAKVYLAGNATKASGETRVFRTTGLSGSKAWNDYTVRVELERSGRTIVKEETISLKAGESQELRFEFDEDKLASAR
jgi:uncharacterized protein (TIGR03000 family)